MTTPIYNIFQWFTQISHMQLIAVLIIFLMSHGNEYRFLPQDVWWNREAVAPKLTQISRISEKSLLCNVSMNTCLDDHASQVESVFSTGTLPLQCATQQYIASYKTILVLPAHGYSNNPKQKSYLHFGHKKYYGYTWLFVVGSFSK